jgi:hypothetical protein
VNESLAVINGHWVADVSMITPHGEVSAGRVCIRCGGHFAHPTEIATTHCPAAGTSHGHQLMTNPDDGLLYCTRCPLVAYDLDDVATEPDCPMPLHR